VTGASIALHYRLGAPEAVVLGAVSGIGGGMLRDLLVREVPHLLRSGPYAIAAIVGAGIVAAASRAGQHRIFIVPSSEHTLRNPRCRDSLRRQLARDFPSNADG
jgi:uncharacterized membrane protein YeiH